MATSLAAIDEQLDELGAVPDELASLVERYGDDDRSLSHVDALLSDLESGVELASVEATALDRPAAAEPAQEEPEPEPEPDAAEESGSGWDPGSAMLDGPEWTDEDAADDPQTGEVPVPDAGEDSGEVRAADAEARDSEPVPRRRRRKHDTIIDSPSSGGRTEEDDTPITGEFLVDDGPEGAPAGDFSDDELDDILDSDEAGDDDVTTIASVDMVAKAGASADADADAGDDDVEDASDEDDDSFEMLIDDDEIELIDDDELEILDEEDE